MTKKNSKARKNGLTMMIDKGLSFRESEDFIFSCSEYTDIVKFAFGTSLLTNNLKEKVNLFHKNNILVHAGGTLFEYFAIRNQINYYKKFLDKNNINMVEISDGCIDIDHDQKCKIIKDFKKDFKVISEVGNKFKSEDNKIEKWPLWIQKELDAGSWKVITESRESGKTGIYNSNGNIEKNIVAKIASKINIEHIIWEAPKQNQQAWLINEFGSSVNLGNISSKDVLSLECLRRGLRADTFLNFNKINK
ncbi:MAG: phosphosulfolactate synthase [Bacteroidota bacterium]|nr:phosphosulfolactate synthase [Bacteroidota bacterium]